MFSKKRESESAPIEEPEVLLPSDDSSQGSYSNNDDSYEFQENTDERLSNEARYSWLMDKWEGDYNNNKIVIEFVSGGNLYVNDRHYGTYKIQNEGNVNIYHGQQIYCYQRGANSYAFTISIKDKKLILNDSYLEKVSTNTDTYEEVESDYDSNDIPNGTYFANEKAFFYNEADENTRRGAYLVEGDIVSVQKAHNGFGYVSFKNSEGTITNGWIKISKLSSVGEYHVYEKVEEMPQFPRGERELMTFLSQNIKYPTNAQEQGIQGTVVLRFVVGKEGLITNVTVMRSLDATCDREAERVIRSMPKWIPGKQNGNPVLAYYTLPIRFLLSN